MPKQAATALLGLWASLALTTEAFAIDARVAPPGRPAETAPPPRFPTIQSPVPFQQPPLRIMPDAKPMAPRTSMPVGLIRVAERGGERVYVVQEVRYNAVNIDTVLDTEDSATQILPGRDAVKDFAPTATTHGMTYGFGAHYVSQMVRGMIGIGPVAGSAEIGLVRHAVCMPDKPKCPIVDAPITNANFGYDTRPATLGLAPTSDPAHPSVPVQLGFRRSLFIAPRTDDMGRITPGDLVFNPTDEETRRFVPLVMDTVPKMSNAAHGCMRNLANGITFCGAIILDSDFSGIEVFQQQDLPLRRNWSTGDKVKLMFTDRANTREIAGVDFTIGLATLPVISFGKPGLYSDPVIRIGQVPYLALEVLTDLTTGQISVAARKTPDADAVGHVP